jgi:hypothetical protein
MKILENSILHFANNLAKIKLIQFFFNSTNSIIYLFNWNFRVSSIFVVVIFKIIIINRIHHDFFVALIVFCLFQLLILKHLFKLSKK